MKNVQMRILDAREQLALIQQELLNEYGITLVSVTVNAPSYFKDAFYVKDLIEEAVSKIKGTFKEKVLYVRSVELEIGYAALLVINDDAAEVKKNLVPLEEENDYSRLFDMDVFESATKQVSRRDLKLPPRSCWICGNVAHECVRSRKHSFDKVFIAYQNLVSSFMETKYPSLSKVVGYAIEAIFLEVYTSPKPGLVDRFDNGSHDDMDFEMFMKSLNAISLILYEFIELGYLHTGDLDELFPQLRSLGRVAEKKMYEATNGVNTHKGIIFLMGVTLGVVGYLCPNMEIDELIKNIQFMGRDLLNELGSSVTTSGERAFNKYQLTGVRGEVVQGFPNVIEALNVFMEVEEVLSLNDALLHTLLFLIKTTDDTTIINRTDLETLRVVQRKAQDILSEGGMLNPSGMDKMKQFNQKLIDLNVSPGGSADLLAMAYFFSKISKL